VIGDAWSGQIEYYDSLTKTLITTSKDYHTSGITSLKYLTNGYVASSSSTVNVWNPITWSSIQVYKGHASSVCCLDQIDDDTILSGSSDQIIHIWKISTGLTLNTIDVGYRVYSVRVLLNGFQIACGLNSNSENLRIYDYSSDDLVQTLIGHTVSVKAIEILNEQYIASGSGDKRVIIWDLETYSIKYNLTGHSTFVYCLKRLSSNLLASADSKGLIIIWNWLQGTLVHRLIGHNGELYFSSLDLYDDQTLISGSRDKTVRIWDISNGSLIQTIHTDIQISALTVLNKGKCYASIFSFI